MSRDRHPTPHKLRHLAPTIWPGQPYPLGATFDGTGVNFALFSEVAHRVELCLFDDAGAEHCLELPESTGFVWHGYVPGLTAGQRYGFRVHGRFEPKSGQRNLPSKLVLDPYARAIEGDVRWNEALFSYHFDKPDGKVNDCRQRAVCATLGGGQSILRLGDGSPAAPAAP